MENQFTSSFDNYACEGDTIEASVNGFDITARLVRDDTPDAPDERQDGYWPSLDKNDPGYIGERDAQEFSRQMDRAKAVMEAWKNDEWFYCGVALSISRNGVCLDDHAASLWGIECNYPKDETRDYEPNSYLTEVANELLSEALDEGTKAMKKLMQGWPETHKPHGLFHTPESMDELSGWIEKHTPAERVHLYTLQGMYYNLIVSNFNLIPKETDHENSPFIQSK